MRTIKLSTSVKIALAILALLVGYFGVRTIFRPPPPTAEAAESDAALFPVLVRTVAPREWRDEIVVNGRTEALRKVAVRAEASGVVEATPTEPGALVEQGALLCRLRVDARQSAYNEARATLAKAQIDHDAAVELAREGFRSEAAVAGAKAALDVARAGLEQARINLDRTRIVAPFAGVFDQRLAEVGDFMNVGDPCGVLIQQSPFLVVGAVSERDVAKISARDRGVARLATGETIEGEVRLVSTSADAATRTFRVELEIPNPDAGLRDGMTAEFTIFAARREAHLVPRSALGIGDDGRVGVRAVGPGDLVEFHGVALLGEDRNGVWVSGLEGPIRIIVRGQDFVRPGQKVAVADADEAT